MSEITVEHNPSPAKLEVIGVYDWPIWTKEISEFPWTYESNETCYILEGKVTVTPDSGQPVQLGEGDLVTFPAGMSCTWQISSTIRKHYQLS
ncbi:MAG: cupin domain-containing protein [Thioploca sp.]|nr:cupin domain-containing protein [Thioploca sp.]